MEEIQEDPERDALIDALVEEIISVIKYQTGVYESDDYANLRIYRESIKDRIKELIMLAVKRAKLYDR